MTYAVRFLRRKSRVVLAILFFLAIVYVSGLLLHPFEESYQDKFTYPLELTNFRDVVSKKIEGVDVAVQPINSYNFQIITNNVNKCRKDFAATPEDATQDALYIDNSGYPRLLTVIKSSLENREHRDAIRQTWGQEDRFLDFSVKRIFVLGSCDSPSSELVTVKSQDSSCQSLINQENDDHKDVIQYDFIDNYYNNTIKTMMSMKWVVESCSEADFIFFVDDDYYVSIKNLLKFAQDPFHHDPIKTQAYDGRLYAGFVFNDSSPMRHISKWYLSLDEYPFNRFPPYINAGAYLVSNRAVKELYFASMYTKHFRFDDIYIGILAKKLGIIPVHSNDFYFWKKSPYPLEEFTSVIASHGFDDVEELKKVWLDQKSRGFA